MLLWRLQKQCHEKLPLKSKESKCRNESVLYFQISQDSSCSPILSWNTNPLLHEKFLLKQRPNVKSCVVCVWSQHRVVLRSDGSGCALPTQGLDYTSTEVPPVQSWLFKTPSSAESRWFDSSKLSVAFCMCLALFIQSPQTIERAQRKSAPNLFYYIILFILLLLLFYYYPHQQQLYFFCWWWWCVFFSPLGLFKLFQLFSNYVKPITKF